MGTPWLKFLSFSVLGLLFFVDAVQADWFQEKITNASQVAAKAPRNSTFVTAWSFGDEVFSRENKARLDDLMSDWSEESKENFEDIDEVADAFWMFLETLTGNGYLTIDFRGDEPEFTLALELKDEQGFTKWFTAMMDSPKVEQGRRNGYKSWHLPGKDAPWYFIGPRWFVVSLTAQEFDRHSASLSGKETLGASARFRAAGKEVNATKSGVFCFVDASSIYRQLGEVTAAEGLDLPQPLDVWDYGVFSVDFSSKRSDGFLALRPGVDNALTQAVSSPAKVGAELFAFLPENMSTMSAVDLGWSGKVVNGVLKSVPEWEMLAGFFLSQAKSYGDPTEAFTGRVVFSSDFLDVLGPQLKSEFGSTRERGQLTACNSNLKNIGTALEMYSTDYSGRYPTDFGLLTPNYLRYIPDCPVAEKDTYSESYQYGPDAPQNDQGFKDYYFFECHGNYHKETPENYPQYNGIMGLSSGLDYEYEASRDRGPEPKVLAVAELQDVDEAHRLITALTVVPDQPLRTECASNLKNIATAMEMYSTDYSGRYPDNLGILTPNYLRTIPDCPAAKRDTYTESLQTGPEAKGNDEGYQDYYWLDCHGKNHQDLEENHPTYNGIVGLEYGEITELPEEEKKPEPTPTEPHAYELDEDISLMLYPERRLMVLSMGREPATLGARTAPLPDKLSEMLNWGEGKSVYVTYNSMQGLYDYALSNVEDERARDALRLLRDWLGELQDVQAVKPTAGGLRYQGQGFNSAPGMGATLFTGAAILVPNFIRARAQGQLTACKSNLKNIGTGLEMWSVDHEGEYPESLEALAPEYLRELPECPAAGEQTYIGTYTNKYTNPDAGDYETYEFYCRGKHHEAVDVPSDHPRYNGIEGLVER